MGWTTALRATGERESVPRKADPARDSEWEEDLVGEVAPNADAEGVAGTWVDVWFDAGVDVWVEERWLMSASSRMWIGMQQEGDA